MKKADIEDLFARFVAKSPNPRGELEYRNPYTLLVAVVLSAQATDKSVNKATRTLFSRVDRPQAMLALGEATLRRHIQTIGLYNSKAKNIIRLSEILVRQYGGKVPPDRAALEALPGVGRKTANVVLNIAFGKPTIAVDTHIFRVANRLGLARGKTPLAVEKALEKAVPEAYRLHAHHWLILHGRYVCTARKPHCLECFARDLCPYAGNVATPARAAGQAARHGGRSAKAETAKGAMGRDGMDGAKAARRGKRSKKTGVSKGGKEATVKTVRARAKRAKPTPPLGS